jgi:hypothetical protein
MATYAGAPLVDSSLLAGNALAPDLLHDAYELKPHGGGGGAFAAAAFHAQSNGGAFASVSAAPARPLAGGHMPGGAGPAPVGAFPSSTWSLFGTIGADSVPGGAMPSAGGSKLLPLFGGRHDDDAHPPPPFPGYDPLFADAGGARSSPPSYGFTATAREFVPSYLPPPGPDSHNGAER